MPNPARVPGRARQRLSATALRTLFALVVWLVLTEGEWSSLVVGAPVIALAVLASFRLDTGDGRAIRFARLPGFAWYFVSRSLLAGIDVARRTLRPQLPLNPAMAEFTIVELPSGTPSWLLAVTISLLPGSLCVESRGERLCLHCLDAASLEQDLAEARRQVARLFAIEPEHSA